MMKDTSLKGVFVLGGKFGQNILFHSAGYGYDSSFKKLLKTEV